MRVFKGVRLLNTGLALGRPREHRHMVESIQILRSMAYFQYIQSTYGMEVVDVGPLAARDDSNIIDHWKAINKAVRDAYIESLMPVVVNGDHSQAVGSVSGMMECNPDAQLLWIDAHADIHRLSTTQSNNLHGTPLSFLSHELSNTSAELLASKNI